jgi:hypothetical protein
LAENFAQESHFWRAIATNEGNWGGIRSLRGQDKVKEGVLCLQAVNWKYAGGSPNYVIPAAEMQQWISKGLSLGFYHIGYYPSNHYSDAKSPVVTTTLKNLMSTNSKNALVTPLLCPSRIPFECRFVISGNCVALLVSSRKHIL